MYVATVDSLLEYVADSEASTESEALSSFNSTPRYDSLSMIGHVTFDCNLGFLSRCIVIFFDRL